MAQPRTGSIKTDIAAREGHVLADGPRILPLDQDALDQFARDLVAEVRAGAGADPIDIMPAYMRTMIRHPALFEMQMKLGTVLFNGRIPPREREIAILRVAWLSQSPFEWGSHVTIARRCGLTDEEIERTTHGSSAPGWSPHEAAILRGVEDLLADFALSDATWETLAQTWDEAQLIEFPAMVGQYVATAYIQNSLRTPLEEGNTGLNRR